MILILQVPFGKLGFMPGQLVHTNEVLVLLGDNWFIERSAKQATEIADRRIKGFVYILILLFCHFSDNPLGYVE